MHACLHVSCCCAFGFSATKSPLIALSPLRLLLYVSGCSLLSFFSHCTCLTCTIFQPRFWHALHSRSSLKSPPSLFSFLSHYTASLLSLLRLALLFRLCSAAPASPSSLFLSVVQFVFFPLSLFLFTIRYLLNLNPSRSWLNLAPTGTVPVLSGPHILLSIVGHDVLLHVSSPTLH